MARLAAGGAIEQGVAVDPDLVIQSQFRALHVQAVMPDQPGASHDLAVTHQRVVEGGPENLDLPLGGFGLLGL